MEINCHEHDKKWVIEQLKTLPASLIDETGRKYSQAFEATKNRRECNTRLREYIEKVKLKATG